MTVGATRDGGRRTFVAAAPVKGMKNKTCGVKLTKEITHGYRGIFMLS